MYEIYTDGGCMVHHGKSGKYAFVVVLDDKLVFEYVGSKSYTTVNEMELSAFYYALRYVNKYLKDKKLTIYADSKYTVDGYNDWVFKWESLGWRRSRNKFIENLDIWKAIHRHRCKENVTVEWVKAHADNDWNNYVDSLTR